jgi:hypothetical protein
MTRTHGVLNTATRVNGKLAGALRSSLQCIANVYVRDLGYALPVMTYVMTAWCTMSHGLPARAPTTNSEMGSRGQSRDDYPGSLPPAAPRLLLPGRRYAGSKSLAITMASSRPSLAG